MKYNNYFKLFRYFINGKISDEPFIVFYKKNKIYKDYPAPTYSFVFYIRNQIFQIYIPFFEKDEFISKPYTQNSFFVIPPMIKNEWVKKVGEPELEFFDLNNKEVVTDYDQITAFNVENKNFGIGQKIQYDLKNF